MHSFKHDGISFLSEQIGAPENDLKRTIVGLFRSGLYPVKRAYLAQAKYAGFEDRHIVLGIASWRIDADQLALEVDNVFRRTFSSKEHLDILFMNDEQERSIRRVCCPFYSSERFTDPDLYLTSGDGYDLEEIRSCYKQRHLLGADSIDYMLCEIEPPIIGQKYGLGGQDIHNLLFANKHEGFSIFSTEGLPCSVYVLRIVSEIRLDQFIIQMSDMELTAWAELYESIDDARSPEDAWSKWTK